MTTDHLGLSLRLNFFLQAVKRYLRLYPQLFLKVWGLLTTTE